jgi:hypothetical protein
MKKMTIKKLMLLLMIATFVNTVNAQLLVRSDHFIQMGYEDYRALTFGIDNNSPNNGQYAIEHWNEGLNFWKPWPSTPAGNYILFLRDDHNVGIGNSGSSSFRLDIEGNARSFGWTTISDSRFKTNINQLESSLTKIRQLKGVSYQLNYNRDKYADLNLSEEPEAKVKTIMADSSGGNSSNNLNIGFVAQELKEVVPEAVTEDENGYLNVNYDMIIPLLVEAVKEQQTQIEEIQNRYNELNQRFVQSTTSSDTLGSFLQQSYPNPASTNITVEYYIAQSDKNMTNYIKIFDSNDGSLVSTKTLPSEEGFNSIQISTSNLENGSYLYSLEINGAVVESKTLLILK